MLSPADGPTIAERLDRLPACRAIWGLVVLLSFGAFFEIYDIYLSAPLSLGLLAAGIFHAGKGGLFGLSDQATFIAVTFAGLWLGALAFSAVADRLGRRPIFTVALVWYAVATCAMGLQSSALGVDAWRFVASVGVGVELVAIDCYLAELAPKALRGRAFAVSSSIQFLSVPLMAVLAWRLIPGDHFGMAGWRWLALVPAVAALGVWQVRRALPELPRWLAGHGRGDEADRIVTMMEAKIAAETGWVSSPLTGGKCPGGTKGVGDAGASDPPSRPSGVLPPFKGGEKRSSLFCDRPTAPGRSP